MLKGGGVVVIHQSAEDYLETILVLREQYGQVRSIDIVNHLGYSKPSVSIAMKKLRESGYISMSPDGLITLNESGLEIARQVYSRHQIITKLFVMMGVPQELAAEDACRVEHDLSQETFERIRDFVYREETV
jgi:Mn-dependent DtxR family transcriptional regulator